MTVKNIFFIVVVTFNTIQRHFFFITKSKGMDDLIRAATTGDLETISLATNGGQTRIDVDSEELLKIAAKNGHFQIVELLLKTIYIEKRSIDVFVREFNGPPDFDALMVRYKGNYSLTVALLNAVSNGHVKIVDLLIKSGANVNSYHFFELIRSQEKKVKQEILFLFLQAGLDVLRYDQFLTVHDRDMVNLILQYNYIKLGERKFIEWISGYRHIPLVSAYLRNLRSIDQMTRQLPHPHEIGQLVKQQLGGRRKKSKRKSSKKRQLGGKRKKSRRRRCSCRY